MLKLIVLFLFAALIGACIYEAVGAYGYVRDIGDARVALERVQTRIEGWQVGDEDPQDLAAVRSDLSLARQKLASAHERMKDDPGFELAKRLPRAGEQFTAFEALVRTTELLTQSGEQAAEALDSYLRLRGDGISGADLGQLRGDLAAARSTLDEAQESRLRIGDDLILPLAEATTELARVLNLLDDLLQQYESLV